QVDLVEQVEELAPELQPVPFAVGHTEALEEREIGAGKRRPTFRVAAERSERPRCVLSEGLAIEPAQDLVAARALARQSGIAGEIDAVLADSRQGVVHAGGDRQGWAALERHDCVGLPAADEMAQDARRSEE